MTVLKKKELESGTLFLAPTPEVGWRSTKMLLYKANKIGWRGEMKLIHYLTEGNRGV